MNKPMKCSKKHVKSLQIRWRKECDFLTPAYQQVCSQTGAKKEWGIY